VAVPVVVGPVAAETATPAPIATVVIVPVVVERVGKRRPTEKSHFIGAQRHQRRDLHRVRVNG
jgi:hypothetical protein